MQKKDINKSLVIVGMCLLVIGIVLLIAKAFSPEYIDQDGILRESFYLLPVGFLSIFASLIPFSIVCIRKFISKDSRN